MALEFRLLGDVEIVIDGQPIDTGHARQRCVTVALTVDANRTVSVDQLAYRVWGNEPPQRYRQVLYSYISRLRRALSDSNGVTIGRGRDGYRLAVDLAAVDLHLFPTLLAQARAARDDRCALALFDQALALWRGEAFGGLDTPWLAAIRHTLAEQRFTAELDRNDVRLRCGMHHQLVPELSQQVDRHPLDERLTGQLMRALHCSGRTGEALDAYHRLRQRLAEELGVDPGREIQRLELAILRNEIAPAAGVPEIVNAVASPVPEPRTGTARWMALLACLAVLAAMLGSAAITHAITNGSRPVQRVQVSNTHKTPIRLLALPRDRCSLQGCLLPYSEIHGGDYLVASCYANGDIMTEVVVRDHWLNTYRSAGWYGIPHDDGSIGYIPEVYLEPQYRGGLELPQCPTTEPLKAR